MMLNCVIKESSHVISVTIFMCDVCCCIQNKRCFTASDVLQDQGLSTWKCFSSSSVEQVCSAIVDRLSRGESICDTEVVDDVSCVDDVVEQLFHTLADESGKLTLTQLRLLIDQLPDDDHKVVRRAEDDHDHDEDGHDHDEDGHDHDEDGHDHDHDDEMNVRHLAIRQMGPHTDLIKFTT